MLVHLSKLESNLCRHLLRGDVILLLVEQVLDALLVDLDFHLSGSGIQRTNVGCSVRNPCAIKRRVRRSGATVGKSLPSELQI